MIGTQAFGPGTGPILLDNLDCEGNETSIADCRHKGWGVQNYCDHNKDVSVSCGTSPVQFGNCLFMAALRSRCGRYLCSSCGFFFFPRLFSAVEDRMSTILPRTVWPQCKFRMHV